MSNLYLFISAVLMHICLVFTITPKFHILQQSSYYNLRYFEFLKTAFNKNTILSIVFTVITLTLAFINPLACLVVTAISCFIRAINAVFKTKNAKKKIVFTSRVKRLYFKLIVWQAIFIAFYKYPLFTITIAALLLVLSPFTAMFINLINAPSEKGIRDYYIEDAKKILKSHKNLKIIGLTGSYGKTSTKYILGRILSEKYNVTITPGSFNTPMGVVRTIRENLKAQDEIFIVEMGAKKLRDIKEICDIVHPTVGIITSIGPQHLNTFGNLENIITTKFELADEVLNNDGELYLNIDNEHIKQTLSKYNYKSKGYSINNKDGAIRAENIVNTRHGSSFDIVFHDKKINVTTKLLGAHNVLNILAAVSVAIDFGISENEIIYSIGRLEPISHRLEMKPFLNGSILIDDAYNSNPQGAKEALNVLGSFSPMKRVVVTPGLVELGPMEYDYNVQLGEECALNSDEIILVGIMRSKPLLQGVNKMNFDQSKVHVVKSFNDAAIMLRSICDKNTVVLFENDLPDSYAR